MKRICVGRIRKPHGVKGEVVVEPYTLSCSFFLQPEVFFYTSNDFVIKLLFPKIDGSIVIAKIDGYTNRDAVSGFCNAELFVDRSVLPSLNGDEYYFEDLKNLSVVDENDVALGTVSNVCDYGAGAFLEIKLINGNIANIPFNKTSIHGVDFKYSKIIINMDFLII